MSRNLLIVESPSKAKTLKKYLGRDFEVLASYGHVRDLEAKEGAVDPDNDFSMRYALVERNKKHVDAIARAAEDADQVLEILGGLRHDLKPNRLDLDQPIEKTTEIEVDQTRAEIIGRLGPSPIAVDELLRQCQSSPPVIGQVLLELDLAGRLERHPGNRVSLLAAP